MFAKIDINGVLFERVAWTGGSCPKFAVLKGNNEYRKLVSFFFKDQLRDCGGLDLWKCAGTSSMDRARIFWNRAKGDAWATLRHLRPELDRLEVA